MATEGFSGREAADIVGITYRQLDYWARTDLIRPSLADAKGSGSPPALLVPGPRRAQDDQDAPRRRARSSSGCAPPSSTSATSATTSAPPSW